MLPRRTIERSGYLKSFPHLAGTIFSYGGDERGHTDMLARVEAGEDWSASQTMTDVVLVPAACYPVYPHLAEAGPLPSGGRTIDVASYCFRHEPSDDPARMQSSACTSSSASAPRPRSRRGSARGSSAALEMLGRLGLAPDVVARQRPVLRARRPDARGEPARRRS